LDRAFFKKTEARSSEYDKIITLRRHSERTAHLFERIIPMLFVSKERGQGLVEYAIILAFVAIVVVSVVRLLGPRVGNTFSTIASSLP
jgi:pilus assembly protein Flp/PilA